MVECPRCRSGKVRRCRIHRPPDILLSPFSLRPFRCSHCGHRFLGFPNARSVPIFITTLIIISALLLGAWFFALRSLWQGPLAPPVAAEDPPKPFETLVQQKLREATGQQVVREATSQ